MGKEALPSIQYKTPEQLAKALEETSQVTLAKRVMEIGDQIMVSSFDWRKELRDKLTGNEQKEIRQALRGTGVEVLLNKDMSAQERMVEKGISELDAIAPVSKFISYGEKFSKAMDVAGELWDKGDYLKAAGVLFSAIFGHFNMEEWNKNEGSDSEKPTPSNSEINIEKSKYIVGISLLLKLENVANKFSKNGIELNSDINAVFLNSDFNKKSFEELTNTKLESGIGKKLGISGNDDSIFKAIDLLKEREKVLDEILSKNYPDWRKKSIYSILLIFSKYSTFYGDIKNVNLEELIKKSGDFIKLDFETGKGALNGILDEHIKDTKTPFYGISKEYLQKLFSLGGNSNFDKDTLLMGEKDDKYEIFVDKFLDFKDKLPSLLGESFYVGKRQNETKEEFRNFFKKYPYSPREALEFFVVTGGSIDTSTYDRINRSMIFTKAFFMLNKDPMLQGETYIYAIKSWALEDSVDIDIPDEVKSAVGFMVRSTLDRAINSTWFLAQRIWGALDDSERVASIGVSIGALLAIGFIIRATSAGMWAARGTVFGGSVAALGTGVIVSKVFSYLQEKHPDVLEKSNIKSVDELQENLFSIKP